MNKKVEKFIDIGLEIGWLLVIFLIPVYFNWYPSYSIFALGKMVVFRVLVEMMLILFLFKVLFFKIRINFSFKKLLPFLVFFLITSLATILSPYLYISFWGSFFRHFGLFSIAHYFAFFLILIFCLKSEKQIKRIILAILFSSFIVCLYAFFQILDLDPFVWAEKFIKTFRLLSTLGQPNFLGAFLVLVIPLTIYSFKLFLPVQRLTTKTNSENFETSKTAGNDKIQAGKKFLARIFLPTLVFLEVFTLFFTLSRSAWLGFLASLLFLFFIYFCFYSVSSKKKKTLIIFILILIVASFFISLSYFKHINFNFLKNPVLYRIASLTDFETPTFKVRMLYWKSGLKIIKERPILGYGLDAQVFPYLKYYSPEATVYEAVNSHPDRAHNEIIDTLITTGILGLISYLFLIGFVFYQGLKKKSLFSIFLLSALFGYLITNQSGFAVASTALYFWLYIALTMFESNKGEEEKEYRLNFSAISKVLIFFVFVVTMLILIKYKNIDLLRADYYYYKNRENVNKRDLLKVIDDYDLIFKYNVYETYYYRQEIEDILNLTQGFKNTELKKDFLNILYEDTKNISSDKENLEYLLYKGQLLNTYAIIDNGKFKEAEDLYLKLSRMAPQMAVIYNDWGRMYLLKKDYQNAIEKFNKALTLYPINHPDIDCCNRKPQIQREASVVYYNLGDAYFFQKDYLEAIKYYRLSFKLNPLDASVYKNLANSYYLQGDIDQAIKENLNGLRFAPKNKDWYENLILLYQEKKDFKKVEEYQDKILKL